MSIEQVKEIANAVLYEGYLLYPYRQSAIKNRQRWTFGVVYPQEYSQANGEIEPCTMQTQCLAAGDEDTLLDVHVRFLHLLIRSVRRSQAASIPVHSQSGAFESGEWGLASRFAEEPVEEGVEREFSAPNLALRDLLQQPYTLEFAFPAARMVEEEPTDPASDTIIREQQPLQGLVTIVAARAGEALYTITVRIENTTPGTGDVTNQRNAIMQHSFISTHTILLAQQGAFVSLLDPPEMARDAAKACKNDHTWPVLIGNQGDFNALLSSPIILYDYPQIAPESPGPLFDGTEIDEILYLRIMTLSDEEKDAMRQGDERVREILERTENMTPEEFMQLHGTIRTRRSIYEEGA